MCPETDIDCANLPPNTTGGDILQRGTLVILTLILHVGFQLPENWYIIVCILRADVIKNTLHALNQPRIVVCDAAGLILLQVGGAYLR